LGLDDPEKCVEALGKIAAIEARVVDQDTARCTFDTALRIALDELKRLFSEIGIARTSLEGHYWRTLHLTVNDCSDKKASEDHRLADAAMKMAFEIGDLAEEMARVGEYRRAIEVAEGLETDYLGGTCGRRSAAGVRYKCATELARDGRFAEAKCTAQRADAGWARDSAFEEIAVRLAGVEQADEASDCCDEIRDCKREARALQQVAVSLAKRGQGRDAYPFFQKAAHAASSIQEARDRTEALIRARNPPGPNALPT